MFGRGALVMGRRFSAGFKDLDDDHAAAADWTGFGFIDGLVGIGSRITILRHQQSASQGDIVGAVAVGEQAVMPDMVESFGEDVDQKAPNELMDRQVHDFVALCSFGSIILPGKGDGTIVNVDQPAVGDGDPMSIA